MQSIEGWEEQIAEAQHVRAYRLRGRVVRRVAYGSERFDWHAGRVPCHDCAVVEGQLHVPGCDVEECPLCHHQLISCGCADPEDEEEDVFG